MCHFGNFREQGQRKLILLPSFYRLPSKIAFESLRCVGNQSKLILKNFPMGISDNRIHRTGFRTGIRYKAPEYRGFQAEVERYRLKNCISRQNEIKAIIQGLIKPRVEFKFYFKHSRLYTKKKTLKRLDVANFIKGTMDSLCNIILLVDDSIFWEVCCQRHISPHESSEFVDIEISDSPYLIHESNPET